MRKDVQKTIGIDYQFHIRRLYFQTGVMMSGDAFLSNNHVQAHLGYGYRIEKNTSNIAIYAGPCYFTGVEGIPGLTTASFYDGFGGYLSLQAITKFTYDIGFGAELFGEVNYKQSMGGIKFILFFSGAYRGKKGNYNPNVRSESRR